MRQTNIRPIADFYPQWDDPVKEKSICLNDLTDMSVSGS